MRSFWLPRRDGWGALERRAQHLALLVAILPSLTFLGHWTVQIGIPGTDMTLTPIEASQHDDESAAHDNQLGHANHCHADAASCTDVPFSGASPFALLRESIAYLGAAVLLVVLSPFAWRPWSSRTVGPEPRPPRRTAGTLAPAFGFGI